jgi:fatty acid desaturase
MPSTIRTPGLSVSGAKDPFAGRVSGRWARVFAGRESGVRDVFIAFGILIRWAGRGPRGFSTRVEHRRAAALGAHFAVFRRVVVLVWVAFLIFIVGIGGDLVVGPSEPLS